MAAARTGYTWGFEFLAPIDVTWPLNGCGNEPIDLGSSGDAACEGAEDGTLTRENCSADAEPVESSTPIRLAVEERIRGQGRNVKQRANITRVYSAPLDQFNLWSTA